jgi:hypothetical protein
VALYLSARQGQGRIKSLINTREGAPIEPGVRETQVRSSELTGNLGIPSPGIIRTTISPSSCDVNSEFGPAKPLGDSLADVPELLLPFSTHHAAQAVSDGRGGTEHCRFCKFTVA